MASESDSFAPGDFELTRAPVLEASLPPAYFFTSKEVYDREVDRIFLKEWLCAGRVEQIPNSGDYFTLDLFNEPIIVVRDDDRELHALSAVCRHKAEIVASGEGNCNSFICPYHAWTYSLKGELIGDREMQKTVDFDSSLYGLLSIRLEVWNHFIFVNFDPECEPLSPRLEKLSKRLENYKLDEVRCTKRVNYEIACNWKVFVDNIMEEYHSDIVHEETIKPFMPMRLYAPEEPHGAWEALTATGVLSATRTMSGESPLPTIESLTEEEIAKATLFLIYPNFAIAPNPTSVVYLIALPEAPQRTTVTWGICFPRSSLKHTDFDEAAEANSSRWDRVNHEDITACESSQRGFQSRFVQSGRYSFREQITHRVHNYVLDRLI